MRFLVLSIMLLFTTTVFASSNKFEYQVTVKEDGHVIAIGNYEVIKDQVVNFGNIHNVSVEFSCDSSDKSLKNESQLYVDQSLDCQKKTVAVGVLGVLSKDPKNNENLALSINVRDLFKDKNAVEVNDEYKLKTLTLGKTFKLSKGEQITFSKNFSEDDKDSEFNWNDGSDLIIANDSPLGGKTITVEVDRID
jgi:hypothetical protein